ncbi:lytic transglycosylase domain-containing protein [Asticcacaulis sp. BYS171W]|uniref:Lytic transglycosylase domain-containing protein n=1 Tax=Asticcacaulis aquaticus TaxID=2984212 RepID=A0ABT5HWU4_9CAUL|nr:lytic transglycosylase domain-containing protein [Asticcacaulis aquaticus]MDC7684320.1 lytic transglycosylase domain-containing protein [Asticcacaulis aquaticus]
MTRDAMRARNLRALITTATALTGLCVGSPLLAQTGDKTVDAILNAPQNAYKGVVQLVSASDTPKKPVAYTSLKKVAPANPALDSGLSPWDAQLYQAAFDAIEKGDFAAADASIEKITDKSLMGYVEFNKLFHAGYTASYEELMSWLERYPDHPQAMRAWNLAKRKKPDGAEDPPFPKLEGAQKLSGVSFNQPQKSEVKAATAGPDSALTPKSARSAYNDGKLDQAIRLGVQIGDRWVAGLAAFRLKRYDEALKHFDFVVNDPSQNAWSQSGGAYWAGRIATKLGRKDEADLYFKFAASFPFTFYGLLAEQRLGVEPAVMRAQKGLPPVFQEGTRGAYAATLNADFDWAKGNPQAKRVSMLVQLNRKGEAKTELQTAIQRSPDQDTRNNWLALAAAHDLSVNQVKTSDRLFDASNYAMPDLAPTEGYKIDKALLYAFAKKESKFNAKAKSYAGAYGLLQLMPATAYVVTRDSSLMSKPDQLLDPAVNLQVGQDYVLKLSSSGIIDGDLLRVVAAYNAGEKWVQDAVRSVGDDADSLLVMESIPVAQTRQYVEEVVASYWIYRQLMGKQSKSLAQAASDSKIIDVMADH